MAASWRELRNKARAYWLVGLKRRSLRRGATLRELVEQLYEEREECTEYCLERLCYDFVNAWWRRHGRAPHGLLAEAAGLPEPSLALLHSGLGMALSRRLLRPLGAGCPPTELAARLCRFLELVRENSQRPFAPVAVEAAGLIVRMFLPRLRFGVAHWMRSAGEDLEGLYWHGVGRGTYFIPATSLPRPGALRFALALCRREPPDDANRLHALAGLAFAVAMINWHQPVLIERLFGLLGEREEAAPHDEAEAFASGVAACVLARRATLAAATPPPPLLRYAPPAAAGPRRIERWESRVRRPCAAILEQVYPPLAARRELACFASFLPLAPLLAGALPQQAAAQERPPEAAPGLPTALL